MKESDIREREVFNQYIRLVEEDCEKFFGDISKLSYISCPACSSKSFTEEFKKNGFEYVTCNFCLTLFVINRPSFDSLLKFYTHSNSTTYWVEKFFKPKAIKRREMIFQPRAQYIAERFGKDPGWLVGDIGAGFGIFLEEIRKLWPGSKYVAIEPSVSQAKICEEAQLNVECCAVENLEGYDNRFDLLTAFELLEHLHDTKEFLSSVYRLLKPGGIFFGTTLNGLGFDIQVLWEKSKSITPPHHLNFFNPESLTQMFSNAGLKVFELDTPGKLDWDIVEGMIKEEGVSAGRFWKLLSERGADNTKKGLQEWIKTNKLSSHMRILVRK